MKNNLVSQKNELVEAYHTDPMSVSEQKVVLTMISMIEPSDDDWKTYSLSVKDFAEMIGLKGESTYSELKKISKTLVSKIIEIPIGEKDWLVATWASSVRYRSDEAIIEFSFDAKLKPYLLQLKNQFTSYRLSNILNLNSTYSIRLYELMKKWQHIGKWTCSVKDLRDKLGANAKSYSVYGNFKNRALLSAIAEVNDKTDIHIKFKEIKKGRAVDCIEFSIQHLQEKEIKISVAQDKPKTKQVEIDLMDTMNRLANGYAIGKTAFNSIYAIANEIYQENSLEKELLALVDYTNEVATTNPEGFMIYLLKNKKEIYENGGNPSIEQIEIFSNEVIPEWFKEQKRQEKLKK